MLVISSPVNAQAPQLPSNYEELALNVATETVEAPVELDYSTTTIEALIDKYADEYGVDKQLSRDIAWCESSYIYNSHNPNDPNTGSYGVYQFQINTFNLFTEQMGEDLDLHNPEHNIKVANWAFSKNYYSHWSCYKIVTGAIDP